MRDAVKTAGEIDYRPSIAITRKGTSHSDKQVGAVASGRAWWACYTRIHCELVKDSVVT